LLDSCNSGMLSSEALLLATDILWRDSRIKLQQA
jgi:hypothetical protein